MSLTKVSYSMITGAPVNVLDFGADSSGVLDSTAAIQNALAAADSVYVPSGTYLVSATLDMKSGQMLFGAGSSTVIKLKNNSSGALTDERLINAGFDSCVVKDLSVDGNASNNNAAFCTAISAESATEAFIKNVWVSNVFGIGISLNASTDCQIDAVSVSNISGTTGGPGEAIYGIAVNRAVISNIIATDIEDHVVYLSGLTASPTKDVQVVNVVSYNAGSSALGTSSFNVYGNCQNISFVNCVSESSDRGFTINANSSDNSAPFNVSLSNCVVNNSENTAISAQGLSTGSDMNLALTGVQIYGAGRGAATVAYGLIVENVNKIDIANLSVRNCNDDGVRFASCNYVNWTGGQSVDNSRRTGTATFYGIRFGDASGTMTAGQVNQVSLVGVNTGDTAASGKLQRRGFYFENGSTNCTVSGGSHFGNQDVPWSKDASTDASCKVFNLSLPNVDITPPASMYGTAAPTTRTWAVGDRVINSTPVVGQPKSWVCTVAGTPGTWVSEGNL